MPNVPATFSKKLRPLQLIPLVVFALLLTMCKKDEVTEKPVPIPDLTVNAVSNADINFNSAEATVEIVIKDGSAITGRGLCYSKNSQPTISDSKTTETSNSFTTKLTNLTAGTKYYLRAYATTSKNTYYSDQVVFTTRTLAGTTWDFLFLHDVNATWHADVTFNSDGTVLYDEPASPGVYLTHGTWSVTNDTLNYIFDPQHGNSAAFTSIITGSLTKTGMAGTYIFDHDRNWTAVLK